MSYDGDESHIGALIYPPAYHARGRCVATALSYSLASAYFLARKKNRLLVEQTYPFNASRIQLMTGTTRFTLTPAVTFRGFDAFADVPSGANRLRCAMLFACAAQGRTVITGTLKFDNGSVTSGVASTAEVTPTAQGSGLTPYTYGSLSGSVGYTATRGFFDRFAAGGGADLVGLELESSASAGDGIEIYTELVVTNDGGAAFGVRPVFAAVWWEQVET